MLLAIAFFSASVAQEASVAGGAMCSRILGQSGKIYVGKCKDNSTELDNTDAILIAMDAIGEKDAEGAKLKKWFNSFAPLQFTFDDVIDGSISGVSAKILGFTASITKAPYGTLGSLRVDTYFFSERGLITNADGAETFNVTEGSMKFAITVTDWSWCDAVGSGNSPCDKVGEFVDLQIQVSSSSSRMLTESANATVSEDVDLGGASMALSSWTRYGDVWTQMATGFPAASGDVYTFRFSKADAAGATTLFYDPVITLAGAESTSTSSATAAPSASTSTDEVEASPAAALAFFTLCGLWM